VYSNDLEDKVKWLKILKDVIHTRKKVPSPTRHHRRTALVLTHLPCFISTE